MKTDQEIQKDVLSELEFDPRVTSEKISVTVANGIVSLRGIVPTYAEKFTAEKAAFRVAGVKAVVEEVQVGLPTKQMRSDEAIAKAAVRALSWNVYVPSSVKVRVEEGELYLSGNVKWAFQSFAAERALRHLKGLRSIVNQLKVEGTPEPSAIKKEIEKALVRSAVEDAKNIEVKVDKTKVILEGLVHSRNEMALAKWAALSASGVAAVDNRLIVN